jgi:hypothetical protein
MSRIWWKDLGEDGIMPAMGQSQNRDDDQIDAMHIQDDASENLLEWRAAEDTPEVFKRVRFLTQWYDAEDSRDSSSYLRFGQLNIWHMVGSARPRKKHLVERSAQSLRENATLQLYDKGAHTLLSLCFLGTKRQDSVPVFIIYSKSKQNRERALREARELPWFRTGNIKIATSSGTIFRENIMRKVKCDPDKI